MEFLLEKLAEKLAEEAVLWAFAQVWGCTGDLGQLESRLPAIRAMHEDAEARVVNDQSLSDWLRKLKDAAYDADDLLEEIQMAAEQRKAMTIGQQVAHVLSGSNPFSFGGRMAREIKEIRDRMEEIASERRNFHLERRQPQIDRQLVIRERQTLSQVDETSIVGRDGDKQSIMRMVMDTETEENVSVIQIVGIGGLGKTTLAQLVYNDERVVEKKNFDRRIWVYVSIDFDPERVVKDMMEAMTGHKCELGSLDVVGDQLREKLKGKRFLLVLDDVWNKDGDEDKWEKLKPIFSVGNKGSKIVVTTRAEQVASMTKATTIYRLKVLPEEDCWALFRRRAFKVGSEEQDPSIAAIGRAIVSKCGGVPLAAKALGSAMRSKQGREAWLAVRDSEMWKPAEDRDGVLSSLKLSYTCLPSHLKQCFTYCSIFPKGGEIDKDDLIAQWIAHGFISSTVGGRQMEDIGNEYFNDLLWGSFFQDLQETAAGWVRCKMHDLVHELAQYVAGGEALILERKKEITGIGKCCRFLALMDCDMTDISYPISLKKMRALILYRTSSLKLADMFSDAQHLRVLHLGEVESLPSSVGNLRNLRYLHVSCKKALPKSFYSLQNLQTLYLSNCDELQHIPEYVSRLHSLRSLVLSNCNHLVTLPQSIGDLRDLRTLNVMNCALLQTIPESIGNLHNLRRINLSFCSGLLRLPETISNLVRLEKLNLEGCNGLELPRGLGSMVNLKYLRTELSQSSCGMPLGVGRLTNLQALGRFVVGSGREHARVSELEHLNQISGEMDISGLRNVGDPEEAGRAKLKEKRDLSSLSLEWNIPADDPWTAEVEKEGHEEAVLESLQPPPNIKKLHIWNYPGASFPTWIKSSPFPNLERINLMRLKKCELLPPLGLLPSLRELVVDNMDAVKRVGKEFYAERIVPFPSLTYLRFSDMPNLEEWCTIVEGDGSSSSSGSGHRAPPPFPCLSTLEIDNCPKLRLQGGFPASVVELTVSASNEALLSQESFQQNAASCLTEVSIRYASSSTRWEGLQRLTSLQALKITECIELRGLPDGIRYLTSLQLLWIEGCPELLELPEWLGDLTSLHSLRVVRCPMLTCLPQGLQRLADLQTLTLESCDVLPELPQCLEDLTSLESLEIAHCPRLIRLPQGQRFSGFTNLQTLSLRHCERVSELPEWLGDLTSLHFLDIECCPMLTSLPPGLRHLTALQSLWIIECPGLARRCEKEQGEYWRIIAHIPKILIDWQSI